jgi:FkbM family methyltransferase
MKFNYRDIDGERVAKPVLYGDEYQLLPIAFATEYALRGCIIDIGANLGAFSVLAHSLFPSTEIHCFEPNPDLFEVLIENTSHIPGITLHQKAVSKQTGLLRFKRYVGQAAGNHLTGVWHPPYEQDCTDEIEVESVRLSEMLTGKQIDILKIDAEGVEGMILEDLHENHILQNTRWIRGEWHGREWLDTIARCLNHTHEFNIAGGEFHGSFIAHRREG